MTSGENSIKNREDSPSILLPGQQPIKMIARVKLACRVSPVSLVVRLILCIWSLVEPSKVMLLMTVLMTAP
jgi:hypothetical protein